MLLKLFENPSKIEQKTTPDRWKCVLGASSAPFRAQAGSRTASGLRGRGLLAPLGSKIMFQGSVLGPLENRKSVKNRICEHRRALWPSKNGVWEWVRKKHQHLIKLEAKIEGFWWLRTTFGVILFAYFTLLPFSKKNRKIDAKIDA